MCIVDITSFTVNQIVSKAPFQKTVFWYSGYHSTSNCTKWVLNVSESSIVLVGTANCETYVDCFSSYACRSSSSASPLLSRRERKEARFCARSKECTKSTKQQFVLLLLLSQQHTSSIPSQISMANMKFIQCIVKTLLVLYLVVVDNAEARIRVRASFHCSC